MEYFTKSDYQSAKKQKTVLLIVYFVVFALFIMGSAGLVTWYALLPYQSPKMTTVKIIHYSITVVFVVFSFVYLGIPFKRANKFYKLTCNMLNGQKETSVGSFFETDGSMQYKDGVEVKSLIFLEWNNYKKDFFERKVLVFYEKPFPQFIEKQNVKYVTQGNVLIEYEILDQEE